MNKEENTNTFVPSARVTRIPGMQELFWKRGGFYYSAEECGSIEDHLIQAEDKKIYRGNSCFFRALNGSLTGNSMDKNPFHQEVYSRIRKELAKYNDPMMLSVSTFFKGLVGDLLITLQDERKEEVVVSGEDFKGFELYKFGEKHGIYAPLVKAREEDSSEAILVYHQELSQRFAEEYIQNPHSNTIMEYINLLFYNDFPISTGPSKVYGKDFSLPLPNMINTVADLFKVNIEVFAQAYKMENQEAFSQTLMNSLRHDLGVDADYFMDLVQTTSDFYDPTQPERFVSSENAQNLKVALQQSDIWNFGLISLEDFLKKALLAHNEMYSKKNVVLRSVCGNSGSEETIKIFHDGGFHWKALIERDEYDIKRMINDRDEEQDQILEFMGVKGNFLEISTEQHLEELYEGLFVKNLPKKK